MTKDSIEIGADREYINFLRITNQRVATPEEVKVCVTDLLQRKPGMAQALIDESALFPVDEALTEAPNADSH